jgi:hypothetical protein
LSFSKSLVALATRLGSALAGGADYGIAHKLQDHGYYLVKNPEGFVVEEEKCKPAFATYVGLELDQSRLDFAFVTPDESGWNDLRPMPILRWPMIGRATLICLVLDPDHDQITRALRGAHE